MTKKAELLSPAGNYEGFLGAIHAGADAVYLAGNQFGARAYADNFSQDEVCRAICYAHLHHRKVYLTVNILLKQTELEKLYEYLLPFYETGLDGVIVQDMGAMQLMKECFPDLELHVSTQMNITGIYGAKKMKEYGAVRIVPARELSLEEIRSMKQAVDIEIETFVHGALCYSYSGVCLFSSILGQRSGNRGRCAQPCRLPYEVSGQKLYPLSLKDLCTIQKIPALLEAGIDSFKIEGRMKKPEYTAGVTAMYRKYMDSYFENPKAFQVESKDLAQLKQLYVRSELQDGYYEKHNGKEMVTLSRPSYSGSDEALLTSIREQFIDGKQQLAVTGSICLRLGEQAFCTVSYKDKALEESIMVTSRAGEVMQAKNSPLTQEAVRKQMEKTGSSPFYFASLQIDMDADIFLPVKVLNELRREALEDLEKILTGKPRKKSRKVPQTEAKEVVRKTVFSASVLNKEQFLAAFTSPVEKIYLSADCLFLHGRLSEAELSFYEEFIGQFEKKCCLALPLLLRKRSYPYLEQLRTVLKTKRFTGVLVRNAEELEWLRSIEYTGQIVSDAGLYCFNKKTKEILAAEVACMTIPYELNWKELLQLGLTQMEVPVYGRIPMMISANCVKKTTSACRQEPEILFLTDRYQKKFPVFLNCEHCFNVIYNSTPCSLHAYMDRLQKHGTEGIRLDFTVESPSEVSAIIAFFEQVRKDPLGTYQPPYAEYTKGHFGRGVE